MSHALIPIILRVTVDATLINRFWREKGHKYVEFSTLILIVVYPKYIVYHIRMCTLKWVLRDHFKWEVCGHAPNGTLTFTGETVATVNANERQEKKVYI